MYLDCLPLTARWLIVRRFSNSGTETSTKATPDGFVIVDNLLDDETPPRHFGHFATKNSFAPNPDAIAKT